MVCGFTRWGNNKCSNCVSIAFTYITTSTFKGVCQSLKSFLSPCLFTFGIMSSMNFCPPKPGSTVITRAMSIWFAHGASCSTVVPGLMATPTCKTRTEKTAETLLSIRLSDTVDHYKPYHQTTRVSTGATPSPSCRSLWSPWWGCRGFPWPPGGMCTGWLLLRPWASPSAPAAPPSCACLRRWQCHTVVLLNQSKWGLLWSGDVCSHQRKGLGLFPSSDTPPWDGRMSGSVQSAFKWKHKDKTFQHSSMLVLSTSKVLTYASCVSLD